MITTLAKINSTTLSKLNAYKVAPNKLWTEANRNLAGDLKATYIGEFDKVTVGFGVLTGTELAVVLALLKLPSFTLYWWDAETQAEKSGTYYAGDYDYELLSKERDLWKPFTVNLIPYKKRT